MQSETQLPLPLDCCCWGDDDDDDDDDDDNRDGGGGKVFPSQSSFADERQRFVIGWTVRLAPNPAAT